MNRLLLECTKQRFDHHYHALFDAFVTQTVNEQGDLPMSIDLTPEHSWKMTMRHYHSFRGEFSRYEGIRAVVEYFGAAELTKRLFAKTSHYTLIVSPRRELHPEEHCSHRRVRRQPDVLAFLFRLQRIRDHRADKFERRRGNV